MKREIYERSKKRNLTRYAGLIGDEFSSKIDQLSMIIGRDHELSIGSYKESLLKKTIKKFIPNKYTVGTGFILFSNQDDNENFESVDEIDIGTRIDLRNKVKYEVSNQLDILVFDSHNYPPIFKDGEFYVVRPESVRSIVEVKGYLKQTDIKDTVENYLELGRKFTNYYKCMHNYDGDIYSLGFYLVGFNVYTNKKGYSVNGKTLRRNIAKYYSKNLTNHEKKIISSQLEKNYSTKEYVFPLLNKAIIHNDCNVDLSITYDKKNEKIRYSYGTGRGHFVIYNRNNIPEKGGDSTISSLLANINVKLDTPFNPHFSYYDETCRNDLLPHEDVGYTDLLTGKEIEIKASLYNTEN